MVAVNFDASTVAPAAAPEAIPAGWYKAMITKSEMKPTSNGQGAYLEIVLQILEGQYAGVSLTDRLNLQNQNQTAVEIAYRTLSAICHATGVIQIQDTGALHNRPLEMKVKVRAAGKGADGRDYEASNEVSGYKAITVGAVPVSAPAPAPFAPPPVAPAPTAPAQQWAPPADAQPAQYAPPAQQAPAPAQQPWTPTTVEQPPVQPAQTQPAPAPVQQAPAAPAAPAGGETPPWMRAAE